MIKHSEIIQFLKDLRDEIIRSFEQLEQKEKFVRTIWKHPSGGGGEMSVLRGKVFEKAAVNWSGVHGSEFPMQDGKGSFFATGISLITHMYNPKAPTVHMNIRYIENEDRYWFAGGYDLTPMGFPFEEDRLYFHNTIKKTLDAFHPSLYPQFSEEAKKYFFIPHRQKERGVGGIFFDHFCTGNFIADYHFWKTIGTNFLSTILPIYERTIHLPYFEEDKEKQLKLRGHYVEFNLLYDRGTQFGFRSGGNPEAILCSLPPLVRW